MSASPLPALILKRTYPHARERVFAAFADARALEQWFSPGEEIQTSVLEFDFSVGGRYRIAFHLPDGATTVVAGRFRRIESPARIGIDWTWEEPDPHAGIRTFVTLEFVQGDGATTVIVRHEKLAEGDMSERHAAGWRGALDRLGSWLSSMDTQREAR